MWVLRFIISDGIDTGRQETHFRFFGNSWDYFKWSKFTTTFISNVYVYLLFVFSSSFHPLLFSILEIYLVQFLFIHCGTYVYLHSIWKYILRLHTRKRKNTISCSYSLLCDVQSCLYLSFSGPVKILREKVLQYYKISFLLHAKESANLFKYWESNLIITLISFDDLLIFKTSTTFLLYYIATI